MSEKQRDNKIVIEASSNGPFIVKNLETLKNSKSEEIETKSVMVLCRCGGSSNKPFCDGTHSKIGFSGKREIDKPLDKEKAYVGDEITIYDNRRICSHAAECVNRLSTVFNSESRPWVDANGADVDSIINVIKQCPSGALSYSIADTHHRDFDREPEIVISKDGPYHITGHIELKHDTDLQPPSKEHYSLCRCGSSKNKPYCDGSHREVRFRDEQN